MLHKYLAMLFFLFTFATQTKQRRSLLASCHSCILAHTDGYYCEMATHGLRKKLTKMKKIKETLIHWLGGYTAEECEHMMLHSRDSGIYEGKCRARRAMRIYADRLYDLSAEDRCEKMYEYLTKEDSTKDKK